MLISIVYIEWRTSEYNQFSHRQGACESCVITKFRKV